jgi:hypothetical protein
VNEHHSKNAEPREGQSVYAININYNHLDMHHSEKILPVLSLHDSSNNTERPLIIFTILTVKMKE